MKATPVIQVFAKYPHVGRVKTRLAAHCGSVSAKDIHQELVERQLSQLQQLPLLVRIELWCDDNADAAYYKMLFRRWPRLTYRRQCEGDLGLRLATALQRGIRFSGQVLQIGTDCPVLGVAEIEHALAELSCGADVVFVPAEDGGYVLGGYTAFHRDLFQRVDWGTNRVLQQSLDQAQSVGLNVVCLPSLWDVDRPEDVLRYREQQNEDLR